MLTFNKSESIYKEDEKLEAPGARGGGRFFGMMSSSLNGGPQYKNVKSIYQYKSKNFLENSF